MTHLNRTLVATLALCGTAAAEPYLGSTIPFTSTSFCLSHTCKLLATIPSSNQDQLHYDVDEHWRVVVWRYPNDRKRVGGKSYVSRLNRVTGVSMIWHGIVDSPFESAAIFAELVTLATGKTLSRETALEWLNVNNSTRLRTWNNIDVIRAGGAMPGSYTGSMEYLLTLMPACLPSDPSGMCR